MFDALPSRIENRIEPGFRKRRRKFHPMMFEELMHVGRSDQDPQLGFLMMVSFFKDDYPWLYEVGLETYRGLKSFKTSSQRKKLIANFENALEMASHPIMREFQDKSDESYFFIKELRHIARHYLERYIDDSVIEDGDLDQKE